jgi:hypothetical protein
LTTTDKSATTKRPVESSQEETSKKVKTFIDDLSPNFVRTGKIERTIKSPPENSSKKIRIFNVPKNAVKRKFPGPAGLLPERKNFNLSVHESPDSDSLEIPCSQTSMSVFEGGPWVEMSRDYNTLVEKFDIKWIKTRASLNKLHNRKAPFLGAIIQNVECFDGKNSIVKVVLKDETGEIQGTIIHNLYEEYSSSLVVGSVVVLKQFSVLTAGANNNHYLTITSNNLVTIYWKDADEVKVIKVQQVSCEELMGAVAPLRPQNHKTVNSIVGGGGEDRDIWKEALEGLDADSFFEDF